MKGNAGRNGGRNFYEIGRQASGAISAKLAGKLNAISTKLLITAYAAMRRARCASMLQAGQQAGAHDEALGSGADPISGVAGYQSEGGLGSGGERGSVLGGDDVARNDAKAKRMAAALEADQVAGTEFVYAAEEGIAMAGDDGITTTGRGRGAHPAGAFEQAGVVGAPDDDIVELEAGNDELQQRRARSGCRPGMAAQILLLMLPGELQLMLAIEHECILAERESKQEESQNGENGAGGAQARRSGTQRHGLPVSLDAGSEWTSAK